MTIDEVYKLIQFIVKKEQQGYLTPDEFNSVINAAQNEFLSLLIGQVQSYQPGRANPRLAWSENESVRQKLTPLIKEANLSIDNSGFSGYPTDYQQADAMFNPYGIYRIRFAQQDSLFNYYRSAIDPVETNPFYLIKSNGFQFYPTTLGYARLSYVSTPNQLTWAYVTNVYGLPIWDAGNSVNPQWYDVDMMDIIARALRIIGVSLQSNDVSQYANEIKNQGQ